MSNEVHYIRIRVKVVHQIGNTVPFGTQAGKCIEIQLMNYTTLIWT